MHEIAPPVKAVPLLVFIVRESVAKAEVSQ